MLTFKFTKLQKNEQKRVQKSMHLFTENTTANCNRTLERYVERSYKFKTYRKEFKKKTAV